MPYTAGKSSRTHTFRAFMSKRAHFGSRRGSDMSSRRSSYDTPLSPGRTRFTPDSTFTRADKLFTNPNPFGGKPTSITGNSNPFANVANPFAPNTKMRNDPEPFVDQPFPVEPFMDQPFPVPRRDRRDGQQPLRKPQIPYVPDAIRSKQAAMPPNGRPGQQSITSYFKASGNTSMVRKPLPTEAAVRPGLASSRSSSTSKVTARSSPTGNPFLLPDVPIRRLILVCNVSAANSPNAPGRLKIIGIDTGPKDMLDNLKRALKGYPVGFRYDQQLGEGSTVTCGLLWDGSVQAKDIMVRSKANPAANIPNPLLTEGLRNKTVNAVIGPSRQYVTITGIYGQDNAASTQLARKAMRALYPNCPHPSGVKISCGLRWDGKNLIVKDPYTF